MHYKALHARHQPSRTLQALQLASRHGRGRTEEDQEDEGLEVHGDEVSMEGKRVLVLVN